MYRLILIVSLFSILCSCSKNNGVNNSQALIGISFGFCFGDCVTMFKLEGGDVFPDIEEGFFNIDPNFSDVALDIPESLVTRFEDLISNTPSLLLDNNESIYGMPDAGDWGSIHFFSNEREWTLDNLNENNPDEIQDFVLEIQDLIMELSE